VNAQEKVQHIAQAIGQDIQQLHSKQLIEWWRKFNGRWKQCCADLRALPVFPDDVQREIDKAIGDTESALDMYVRPSFNTGNYVKEGAKVREELQGLFGVLSRLPGRSDWPMMKALEVVRNRTMARIAGHILADRQTITWSVMQAPSDRDEGMIINFPFSGDPPSARDAKWEVANALKHEKLTWIAPAKQNWTIDLEKMCEYFKFPSTWLSRRVIVSPEYEIRLSEFKQGVMHGVLGLYIERDSQATDTEPSWGDYDGDLADLVSILKRNRFEQDLTWLCSEATSPFSVAMIDLDHFKQINDTLGHPAGDAVLMRVSEIVREVVGRRGLAYRYGGEELSVLLPGFTSLEAFAVGERIRSGIESEVWSHKIDRVTVSIGVAQRILDEPSTSLVRRADAAMYEAKRSGRNRVIEATQPDG
jgi:diguanylate cyclase (GGDEF)-like protein